MNTARVGALCAGYGGLERGLQQVLDTRLAWVAEIDPAAAQILAHRWPGVPNHGDLTTTGWATVEPVDIITAGFPCQPWSAAGKRLGATDDRAIWPAIADAVGVLRPGLVLLENVPGIVVRGELARVLGDLAALGFDAEWSSVPASGVGAPHRRERVFILAQPADTDRISGGSPRSAVTRDSGGSDGLGAAQLGRRIGTAADTGGGEPSTDSAGDGWGEGRPEPARQLGGSNAALSGDAAARSDGNGLAVVGEGAERHAWDDADGRSPVDWGGYRTAIARWGHRLGRPAPAPTVLGARGGRQLSARFVEWLMGLPEGWVTDVPGLTRNQQLKALGNGVVPQQAAAALRHLLPLLLNDTQECAA